MNQRASTARPSLTANTVQLLGLMVVVVVAVAISVQHIVIAAVFAGMLVALLLVLTRPHPTVWITLGLISIASSSSGLLGTADGTISICLRLMGIILVVIGAISSTQPQGEPAALDHRRPYAALILGIFISMSIYVVSAMLLHQQLALFFAYSSGIALLALFQWATLIRVDHNALKTGLISSLTAVIAASLLTGIIYPQLALERERLRGLAENANGLGCYAFILGASAVLCVRSTRARLALLMLSGTTIIWSGSRNSALALCAVILIKFALGSVSSRLMLALGSLSIAPAYVAIGDGASSILGRLLSVENTRSVTYSYALQTFRDNVFGIGFGNETTIVASSPMRAIVHAGVFGLLAVVLMWVFLMRAALDVGAAAIAFSVGAVLYSMFEGILLSPYSPFLLIFLAAWAAVARSPRDRTATDTFKPFDSSSVSGPNTRIPVTSRTAPTFNPLLNAARF